MVKYLKYFQKVFQEKNNNNNNFSKSRTARQRTRGQKMLEIYSQIQWLYDKNSGIFAGQKIKQFRPKFGTLDRPRVSRGISRIQEKKVIHAMFLKWSIRVS